ncbi:ribonuclease III [Oscillatoria salina]|uniref:ribonuclease III n=1 Tax=Oscillatoria salina TaxID=331517 RepID=UPI0013BAB726|nr:ribonuclease III [Oscillatoria salina]MBZ8180730.1 ribonuclease III [Oscillatoria salina IIICB1]NET87597.1 ribonuclease III [Kamptonema sp. SIO1D9]
MEYKLPPIQSRQLFLQALTHRSFLNENPNAGKDNERLEFLGDAVLGFLVGELLFKRYPDKSEAEMTRLRSKLVDEPQLAKLAALLNLGKLLRLGKGAEKDGGRQNPALLCDVFEAVIGAYFLEVGIEEVRNYIEPMFTILADNIVASPIENNPPKSLVDCKNRFQQWALENFKENPQYLIIKESGEAHAKEFTAEVRVNNQIYGTGKGKRKQEAQKQAAKDALKNLGLE